jgi:hypothetical protein
VIARGSLDPASCPHYAHCPHEVVGCTLIVHVNIRVSNVKSAYRCEMKNIREVFVNIKQLIGF